MLLFPPKKVTEEVSIGNPTGMTYISGSESIDGSARLSRGVADSVKIEERENGVWNKGKLQISADTLYLGDDIRVGAIGHYFDIYSVSQDQAAISVVINYDTTGTEEAIVPILAPKEFNVITNSDFAGENIGTSYNYIVQIPVGYVLSKIHYKTGSVSASSQITVRVYRGTIANLNKLIFEQNYPASQFPANSDVSINVGKLNYKKNEQFLCVLSSEANFSIKTSLDGIYPYRAVDRWLMTHARISYASMWSETSWAKDDWIVEGGKIYVCNTTGAQTGTFISNILKWDLLSALVAKVTEYKGGITVSNFNTLTSANKGEQYKLLDSGTLVGMEVVNANDSVIIRNTFSSRLITGVDYDYFAEPSDTLLQSGRSGGQQLSGGVSANENLILKSTENITKGRIFFGDSVYDELNGILSIGTTELDDIAATGKFTVKGNTSNGSSNIFVGRDNDDVSVIEIDTDGNIKPAIDNTSTIGTPTMNYKEVNTHTLYSNDDLTLDTATDKNIIAKKDILPDITNTRSIGSILKAFVNIFTRKVTSDDDLILNSASSKAIIIQSNNGIERARFDGDSASTRWTNKVNYPSTDATDAFKYTKADKTTIIQQIDTVNGSIGIGGTPDVKSLFDLQSTTKGFLLPRMTQTQRLAITSPPEGLEIFDITNHGKYCYSNSRWCQISGLARLVCYKTVDIDISTNMDISFVIGINYNMGTITTPSIPLIANKSYIIHAYTQVDGDGTTAGARFSFVNSSDNSNIPELYSSVCYTATSIGHTGTQPIAGGIYRPTSNISIKLRVVSISGSPKLMYETFRIEIQQLD